MTRFIGVKARNLTAEQTMRFYRVSYQTWEGEHGRYDFFTSKRAADKKANDWRRDNTNSVPEDNFYGDTPNTKDEAHDMATVEAFDITPTKKGILKALNDLASHADNG